MIRRLGPLPRRCAPICAPSRITTHRLQLHQPRGRRPDPPPRGRAEGAGRRHPVLDRSARPPKRRSPPHRAERHLRRLPFADPGLTFAGQPRNPATFFSAEISCGGPGVQNPRRPAPATDGRPDPARQPGRDPRRRLGRAGRPGTGDGRPATPSPPTASCRRWMAPARPARGPAGSRPLTLRRGGQARRRHAAVHQDPRRANTSSTTAGPRPMNAQAGATIPSCRWRCPSPPQPAGAFWGRTARRTALAEPPSGWPRAMRSPRCTSPSAPPTRPRAGRPRRPDAPHHPAVPLGKPRLRRLRRFPHRLSSRKRKMIRKERETAHSHGLTIRALTGDARSNRSIGMPSGPSTRTPAAANGAAPT
jgi:hypothetical protein